FSAYLTLWFPLLIWWTPLCRMLQIMTRRFTLYAYQEVILITLYMPGTAAIIDGVSVDYITVNEEDAEALKEAGWRESAGELKSE
ncbi:hypothetical protein, partial [Klebsiella michiganensis]|uniref:hypothetical protein n=1 Tax=Klebsiella michiganensis TaxID=1134687 RepID=UPI00249BA76E